MSNFKIGNDWRWDFVPPTDEPQNENEEEQDNDDNKSDSAESEDSDSEDDNKSDSDENENDNDDLSENDEGGDSDNGDSDEESDDDDADGNEDNNETDDDDDEDSDSSGESSQQGEALSLMDLFSGSAVPSEDNTDCADDDSYVGSSENTEHQSAVTAGGKSSSGLKIDAEYMKQLKLAKALDIFIERNSLQLLNTEGSNKTAKLSMKLLLKRVLNKMPYQKCIETQSASECTFLLDTSPSCNHLSSQIKTLLRVAIMRGDCRVLLVNNITSEYYSDTYERYFNGTEIKAGDDYDAKWREHLADLNNDSGTLQRFPYTEVFGNEELIVVLSDEDSFYSFLPDDRTQWNASDEYVSNTGKDSVAAIRQSRILMLNTMSYSSRLEYDKNKNSFQLLISYKELYEKMRYALAKINTFALSKTKVFPLKTFAKLERIMKLHNRLYMCPIACSDDLIHVLKQVEFPQ